MNDILQKVKIIKHTITIKFVCENANKEIELTLNEPTMNRDNYTEDWEYVYVEVTCPECKEKHKLEI